ncbi:hypothetical protein FOA52_012869 [Chlamydomonas sp. UWO 241]|nr:hypothetical protein FOA52_012869 [Chlamydomonas sp. UWO 241]
MFAFKRFNFFGSTEVHAHGVPDGAVCYAPSATHLYCGDHSGTVTALDDRAAGVFAFAAHGHKVLDALYLEHGNLLLTVGTTEPGVSSAQLKVWEVSKLEALAAAAAAAADGGGGDDGGGGSGGVAGAAGARAGGGGGGRPSGGSAVGAGGGGAGGGGGSSKPAMLPSPTSALLRTVKLFTPQGGYTEAEVTAFAAAVTPGSSTLTAAVGLSSGMVYVISGDVSGKGKLQHTAKLNARPDGGDHCVVMGLQLLVPGTGPHAKAGNVGWGFARHAPLPPPLLTEDGLVPQHALFVVTESQTLSFNVQTGLRTILDQQGSRHARCTLLRNGLLVVARDEGLYDYTLDTRAGCTVFEGAKQQLAMLRRFHVVVTREGEDDASSGAHPRSSSTVHVLDARNRMTAGCFPLASVRAVVPAWGALLVLTAGGRAILLRQVELSAQLDTLFKRSLHKLALEVAKAEGADAATIASIQHRWGDHLYAKGEYDAAMQQYLQTLSVLEPSYVIRRFLDAQRIHNLTQYLELLHTKDLATADHTTLLLNCFTKLKDVEKLDAFIHGDAAAPCTSADHHQIPDQGHGHSAGVCDRHQTFDQGHGRSGGAYDAPQQVSVDPAVAARFAWASGTSWWGRPGDPAGGPGGGTRSSTGGGPAEGGGGDWTAPSSAVSSGTPRPVHLPASPAALRFDAETAVRVLRAAGYHQHALWVASAACQPEWVLEILLDDTAAYDDAIAFLDTLPRPARAQALRRYGKVLISRRAETATRLLMELCIPHGPHASASEHAGDTGYVASVADFAHLYSDRPTALMLLCEFILNSGGAGGISGQSAAPGGTAATPAERMLYHTLLELYLAEELADEEESSERVVAHAAETASASAAAAAAAAAAASAGSKEGRKGGKKSRREKEKREKEESKAGGAATAAAAAAPGGSGATGAAGVQQQGQPAGGASASAGCSTGGGSSGGGGGGGSAGSGGGAGGGSGAKARADASRVHRRARAVELLQSGWPHHTPDHPKYDPDHALVLCRLHGCSEGLVFLYDRLRLYRELLQVFMDGGDADGLIAAALRYGDNSRGGDPQLWGNALEHFIEQGVAWAEAEGEAGGAGARAAEGEAQGQQGQQQGQRSLLPPPEQSLAHALAVAAHIEDADVMPPLLVLQALERHPSATVGHVRDFLSRALTRETADLAEGREAVSRLALETSAMRKEVQQLRKQPRVFQNSKCSVTGQPLELPVVHFYCGHSFNQRSLGDNDAECPICAPDFRRVLEIRRNLTAGGSQQDRFFTELRETSDGFSVVAEHFGRGLMNMTGAALPQAPSASNLLGGVGGGLLG